MKITEWAYNFRRIPKKSALNVLKRFWGNREGNEESHEKRTGVLLNKGDDQNVGDV